MFGTLSFLVYNNTPRTHYLVDSSGTTWGRLPSKSSRPSCRWTRPPGSITSFDALCESTQGFRSISFNQKRRRNHPASGRRRYTRSTEVHGAGSITSAQTKDEIDSMISVCAGPARPTSGRVRREVFGATSSRLTRWLTPSKGQLLAPHLNDGPSTSEDKTERALSLSL